VGQIFFRKESCIMQNFRSYQLSVTFYKNCKQLSLPAFLKTQLLRAASSITLNLAEGSAKSSKAERSRFYGIAFASAKECRSVLELEDLIEMKQELDVICAHIYKLIKSLKL
jgi:four helix bundle protein